MNQETERKLRLMRFLREENQNNRMQMHSREEILYGKSSAPVQLGSLEEEDYLQTYDSRLPQGPSAFGVRMMLALLLFAGVWYMDRQGYSFGKINADWIRQQISAEGSAAKWIDFAGNFPYTLHIEENPQEND